MFRFRVTFWVVVRFIISASARAMARLLLGLGSGFG
jgi:hypothetical protein